jgi:hypothetical protein
LNIRDGSDGTTNYFFNDNKNKLMTISWNNQPAWLTLEQDKEHNHIKVKWTSAPAGFNDQHFNFHVISETGKEETFFIFLHAIEVISFVSTTQTKFSITHTFAPGPFDDYYQFVANSTRPANTITYALSEHVGYFYMANNGWLGHNNPTMGESFTQFAYVIATSSTGVSCKIQCEFKIYSTE